MPELTCRKTAVGQAVLPANASLSLPALPLLLLLALTAQAQTKTPSGESLYRQRCSPCHGDQADGGRSAPSLTHTTLSDADMFRTISTGIPNSEMAAYASRLSPAEIRSIVAFLRSTATAPAPFTGDASRGSAIFWGKGACGNCHSVGNRGSLVGPDLSRIGRQRNLAYLQESLLKPSAEIARGFEGVTVVLSDGSTLRGLQRALDDFSVVLQDFSGKVYSFDRKDIRSVARDAQSLMPESTLSSTELNDVLAYLSSLGGSVN